MVELLGHLRSHALVEFQAGWWELSTSDPEFSTVCGHEDPLILTGIREYFEVERAGNRVLG